MLNNRQKFALIFGLVAICAICLCPPWRLYGAQEKPLGFGLIFNPPVQGFSGEMPGKIDLDNSRLTLEIVLAAVLTGGMLVVGGGGATRPGVAGQGNQGGFMQRLAEMREQMVAAQQAQLAAQATAQKATAPAQAAATAAAAAPAATKAPVDANHTRVELPANYYLGELLNRIRRRPRILGELWRGQRCRRPAQKQKDPTRVGQGHPRRFSRFEGLSLLISL